MKRRSPYYYLQLKKVFKELVPPKKRVLEIGSEAGEILSWLKPQFGVDIVEDKHLISQIGKKHPQLFDYIILPDVIDHSANVFATLRSVRKACRAHTRVVIAMINPTWEPVLRAAEKLGWKRQEELHNWLLANDLVNLIELAGFKVNKSGSKILLPKDIPIISDFLNNNVSKLGFFGRLGIVQYFVCKKTTQKRKRSLGCSVVIPAFNEADNIARCIKRIPRVGSRTEIIVVDDGSTDDTKKRVKRVMLKDSRVRLFSHRNNRGKVWAVKTGFDNATGEVLMILDADMSVPPEELPFFHQLIALGQAGFVNGTRMVYPMENQAMRYLNQWGNKVFSTMFSWILNQRVTDTLCGTKVLLKKHYEKITLGTEPWGDFDLLFGAAKQKLKIVEFPVHYKRRVAGESKMRALRHGWQLLRMSLKGIYELKLNK